MSRPLKPVVGPARFVEQTRMIVDQPPPLAPVTVTWLRYPDSRIETATATRKATIRQTALGFWHAEITCTSRRRVPLQETRTTSLIKAQGWAATIMGLKHVVHRIEMVKATAAVVSRESPVGEMA